MKNGILIVIILAIISGIASYTKVKKVDAPVTSKIENIKSFHFFYTKGYTMNSDIKYDVELKDGEYIATIKLYEKSEDEVKELELSKEQVQKLEDILNKYQVYKWNGFDKTDKNVLDGDSFSLSIYLEDGTSISAHGYMKWPDNYRIVRGELDEFFEGLIEE